VGVGLLAASTAYSAYDRYFNQEQSGWQALLGGAADATGISAVYAGITGRDLATQHHLSLTPAQQRQMLTEGSIQAVGSALVLYGGVRSFLRGRVPVAPIQNAGRLTFDPATRSWRSTGGLVYGQGSAQGNRVLHVLEHLTPDPSKPLHTLFNVPRNQIIGLLDEAWAARQGAGVLQANGNRVFNIPMGRVVGAGGETSIRIVVRDGTTNVITAFPVP